MQLKNIVCSSLTIAPFFLLVSRAEQPNGIPPKYVFTLYALDTNLDLEHSMGLVDFMTAIKGHIIEEGQLVGLFTKP